MDTSRKLAPATNQNIYLLLKRLQSNRYTSKIRWMCAINSVYIQVMGKQLTQVSTRTSNKIWKLNRLNILKK